MGRLIETQCCIAGGGPAGLMLGYLLARAGVDVTVLEKHADFLRDFRGDTVHPSTLELFHELGELDAFLELPHERVERLGGIIGDTYVQMADFSNLPTQAKFIAMAPQWDLLDFLADRGGVFSGFHLHKQTEVTDLIEEDGVIRGVRATTPQGEIEVRAPLTVGCDGRHSTIRARAGLKVKDLGAPLDVFWFHLPIEADDEPETTGRFVAGSILIQINRSDYWQCAYVIPKGAADDVRARGLPAFRESLAAIAPPLAERTQTLNDWNQVKLLTVRVDRLETWYRPGLLCIGDAAHAMSPIGGIGINLAVQDAVATANRLWRPLKNETLATEDLAAVQRRRQWPAKVTQFLQVQAQNRIIAPTLRSQRPLEAPWIIRNLSRIPLFRELPARLIGLGVRPEHIRSPQA